jgi:hypothetical protein
VRYLINCPTLSTGKKFVIINNNFQDKAMKKYCIVMVSSVAKTARTGRYPREDGKHRQRRLSPFASLLIFHLTAAKSKIKMRFPLSTLLQKQKQTISLSHAWPKLRYTRLKQKKIRSHKSAAQERERERERPK